MKLVPQTEARPFIFHARWKLFSWPGFFFLCLFAFLQMTFYTFWTFLSLMLFRTSTFASFFLFCWHESFSFLFLYFLQTSSAFLLFLMFLLHQAQEAQPGGKPGHRIFHAKHGLSLLHGKTSYPFSTPSISLFSWNYAPPPTFHTFTPEQASQSLTRRTFPSLSKPETSFFCETSHFCWNFLILRHEFFLQVSIFSMLLMFLFFFAFASFCFYLFSSPSLLRLFLANLRLFMLFSHFLCFFANPLATFFYFYFYFCIFH